jgi:hypothetical protein
MPLTPPSTIPDAPLCLLRHIAQLSETPAFRLEPEKSARYSGWIGNRQAFEELDHHLPGGVGPNCVPTHPIVAPAFPFHSPTFLISPMLGDMNGIGRHPP